MEILEPKGQRFEIALELFRDGQPLTFRNVGFALAPGGHLIISTPSSWYIENTNEQTALSDFKVAEDTLNDLIASSPAFASLVEGRSRQFVLIHDYGMGAIALCRLIDGSLIWT